MRNASGEAAVNAGNLFCNAGSVARQTQSDLLDSNLLAQLAADKRCSRFTEASEWYKAYCETLGKIAWQFGGLKTSVEKTDDFFTVQDVLLKVIKAVQPSDKATIAAEAMESLQSLAPQSDPQRIFQQFNHAQSTVAEEAKHYSYVNVQISVLSAETNICLVGLYFTTKQAIENTLDTEFDTSKLKSKVQAGVLLATLNEEIYAPIRQSVITKLGSKRDELIAPFSV